MTTKNERQVQQLRADADALDAIGSCAWDDADAKRAQARALEAELPHYDVAAATKLAVGTGLVAACFAYAVNGQDLGRAVVASLIALTAAWYAGKVIYARPEQAPTVAGTDRPKPA